MIGLDTRDFLEAFVLFQARAELSFTECITLVRCKKAGIESILSHNKHFASEGLNLLF
jgi:predicted nucleic acid-binding protein